MLELIALLAALAICIWTPIEARKVRAGWMRKSFKGSHAEFVAKYRQQLAVIGWVGLVLGIGNLSLGLLGMEDMARQAVKLLAGVIWLAASGISILTRRRLPPPVAA